MTGKPASKGAKRGAIGLAIAALMCSAAPGLAQKAATTTPDARMKKLEAEMAALQRQVFPGGDGKYFTPEIQKAGAATVSAAQAGTTVPAATPVTDLLTRMDTLENQLSRLTAQNEESNNRIAQLEAKLAALTSATPAVVATVPATAVSTPSQASTIGAISASSTSAASTPVPVPSVDVGLTAPATTTVKPAIITPVTAALKPAVITPKPVTVTPKPAPVTVKPVAPSAQRVAAVKAVIKPQSMDPAQDDYDYGFRLYDAKFYPEAEQQLQIYLDKNPRHRLISHARNLMGRALLDEGKPEDASRWFFKNYQADSKGARAADSLLFLAEAMRQTKDYSRSCVALSQFANEYPAEAAGRLKTIYESTRTAVKCN